MSESLLSGGVRTFREACRLLEGHSLAIPLIIGDSKPYSGRSRAAWIELRDHDQIFRSDGFLSLGEWWRPMDVGVEIEVRLVKPSREKFIWIIF